MRATGVDVRLGKFQVRDRHKKLSAKLDAGLTKPRLELGHLKVLKRWLSKLSGRPLVKVELPKERFTDVAIATELVRDFHTGECDIALVITNDSDISPAIASVVDDGHNVQVISPFKDLSNDLKSVASRARPIRSKVYQECELPKVVTNNVGKEFHCPNAWYRDS